MYFRHYSLRINISLETSFQCSLKLIFQKVPWNFLQSFMELFEQHLNNMRFHGIQLNLSNKTSSSMDFHGILSKSEVPWNSMELFPYSRVPWNYMGFYVTFHFPKKVPGNSMEFHLTFLKFHGIPWNSMELDKLILKKIIFLNIVVGIWLMNGCYLAKISQKRYILHWFQYRYSCFEHPSVSENGARSAKMACCYFREHLISQMTWHDHWFATTFSQLEAISQF